MAITKERPVAMGVSTSSGRELLATVFDAGRFDSRQQQWVPTFPVPGRTSGNWIHCITRTTQTNHRRNGNPVGGFTESAP